MEKLYTDILVVGAGPAGSAAALAAAGTSAASILVIERKKIIGHPVQCAEFIPARIASDLQLGTPVCVQKIRGMHTYIQGRLAKTTRTPGYTIHRGKMDQLLARRAADSGCRILTSTRAVSMSEDGTVLIQDDERIQKKVMAKIVIAADGPLSIFRRWLNTPRQRLLPAVQKRFALTTRSDHTSVYFSPEIFGGYGWVFPKNDHANVGLGFTLQTRNHMRAAQLLEEFVLTLKEKGVIEGEPLASSGGWIPVEPLLKAVMDKVVFVGDAAGHTHPITGAGIFSALTCGEMAGRWAAEAIRQNDVDLLQCYDEEWRDLFTRSLVHAFRKRTWMEAEWQHFDQIIKSCWIAFSEYHGSA